MTIVTATFIAFVVAQIADAGSTILALDRKGVREANPVLRWLMDRIGLGPALFFPKLAYVALAKVGAVTAGVNPRLTDAERAKAERLLKAAVQVEIGRGTL